MCIYTYLYVYIYIYLDTHINREQITLCVKYIWECPINCVVFSESFCLVITEGNKLAPQAPQILKITETHPWEWKAYKIIIFRTLGVDLGRQF